MFLKVPISGIVSRILPDISPENFQHLSDYQQIFSRVNDYLKIRSVIRVEKYSFSENPLKILENNPPVILLEVAWRVLSEVEQEIFLEVSPRIETVSLLLNLLNFTPGNHLVVSVGFAAEDS